MSKILMTEEQMNWLILRSENDAAEWSHNCENNLSRLLGSILTGSNAEDALKVSLSLPSFDDAKNSWEENTNLYGELTINSCLCPDLPLNLKILLPFQGVFLISRRHDSVNPLPHVWSSWLGEAPGFRLVRRLSSSKERIDWRIGLPCGHFVSAPCSGELSEGDYKKLEKQSPRFFCEENAYPDWLREHLGKYGPFSTSDSENKGTSWLEIHRAITARAFTEPDYTDQETLDHRVLVTFPIWLKWRLCNKLLAITHDYQTKGKQERRLVHSIRKKLIHGGNSSEDDAASIWNHLVEMTDFIGSTMIPFQRTRFSDEKKLEYLQYVEPTNPVDLVSRLTRVKRLNISGKTMAELPAEFRQNHTSFQGRICPVESPESELVGLSLQLAQGARVDSDGRIHARKSGEPIDELGYGASLIPFFQHNDGVRNMMGSKNLRQAIPVKGKQAPAVRTGGERTVVEMTRDLVNIGICQPAIDENGEFALGKDLLVAYIPWYGMNFEDAIVVGRHVVDSGDLDVEVTKRFQRRIAVGWEPCDITSDTNQDIPLYGGSPIARFNNVNKPGMRSITIAHKERIPAKLKSIRFSRPQPWMDGILEYECVKELSLKLGDKLMGRHGNKGVVGAIVESMPRLPDDDDLPEEFRGRKVDVLLNPHGVISRMNAGQLLETHIGWLLYSKKCSEQDIFKNSLSPHPVGYPFAAEVAAEINHDKVKEWLQKTGLDKTGRIQLILPNGEKTLSPVAVGFQHIVRLRHIPEEKAQARRAGGDARYSQKTGQAVHGRSRGGGQRVGEMEVWALASHEARHNLEEMLGGKADSGWASEWQVTGNLPTGKFDRGFPTLFKDWLKALLIKVEEGKQSGEVKFSFLNEDEVVKEIGLDNLVENSDKPRKRISASFCCPGVGDKKCGRKPFEEMVAVLTTLGEDSAQTKLKLKVDDLLKHLGIKLKRSEAPVQQKEKNQYLYALQLRAGRDNAGALLVEFPQEKNRKTVAINIVIRPGVGADHPSQWPENLHEISAYCRFYDKELDSVDKVLRDLLSPDSKHSLADFSITCPTHATVPLEALPPFGEITLDEPERGLFDEAIFGTKSSKDFRADSSWGMIELPVAVPFPLHAFLRSLDSWRKQYPFSRFSDSQKKQFDDKQKELEQFFDDLNKKLHNKNLSEDALPKIKWIPVLPRRYRERVPTNDGLMDCMLVRKGYSPLLNICMQYREAGVEKRKSLDYELNYRVAHLFARLLEELRHKEGFVRHYGLGRRIDRSARLVIIPNPELHWDQVGVPATVLWELMGDQVEAWQEKTGRPALSEKLAEIKRNMEINSGSTCDVANNDNWSWLCFSKDKMLIGWIKNELDEFLQEHKDKVVLLNRQPSLHRDSFQAFHPVPLVSEAGDVMQICPLSCKGFGADFDGDEMVIHFPVSGDAQKEARRLLPSNNLFSMASGDVIAHFDQDFVMGSWLMEPKYLHNIMSKDCCRNMLSQFSRMGSLDKKTGEKVLEHLCKEHSEYAPKVIHEWMQMAFNHCTKVGVSFGFYDIFEGKENLKTGMGALSGLFEKATTAEELDQVDKNLNQQVEQHLKDYLPATFVSASPNWAGNGLHFAAMAMSGARGRKQVHQFVGARGFLNPGSLCFELSDYSRFGFGKSLAEGMDKDAAFWAAMNARSSMCDKKLGTGHAGNLSRHLVFALWRFAICSDDCETTIPGVLTCEAFQGEEYRGCCPKCYGELPNGKMPGAGFPAGLIAAQSIGERGTQLSMQSFHAGKQEFTIKDVKKHLNDEAKIADIEGWRELKQEDAYKNIQDRHFHILWRVLRSSADKTLRSAITGEKGLSRVGRMAFQDQAREIIIAALTKESAGKLFDDPFVQVLYGFFGSRADELTKHLDVSLSGHEGEQ